MIESSTRTTPRRTAGPLAAALFLTAIGALLLVGQRPVGGGDRGSMGTTTSVGEAAKASTERKDSRHLLQTGGVAALHRRRVGADGDRGGGWDAYTTERDAAHRFRRRDRRRHLANDPRGAEVATGKLRKNFRDEGRDDGKLTRRNAGGASGTGGDEEDVTTLARGRRRGPRRRSGEAAGAVIQTAVQNRFRAVYNRGMWIDSRGGHLVRRVQERARDLYPLSAPLLRYRAGVQRHEACSRRAPSPRE